MLRLTCLSEYWYEGVSDPLCFRWCAVSKRYVEFYARFSIPRGPFFAPVDFPASEVNEAQSKVGSPNHITNHHLSTHEPVLTCKVHVFVCARVHFTKDWEKYMCGLLAVFCVCSCNQALVWHFKKSCLSSWLSDFWQIVVTGHDQIDPFRHSMLYKHVHTQTRKILD